MKPTKQQAMPIIFLLNAALAPCLAANSLTSSSEPAKAQENYTQIEQPTLKDDHLRTSLNQTAAHQQRQPQNPQTARQDQTKIEGPMPTNEQQNTLKQLTAMHVAEQLDQLKQGFTMSVYFASEKTELSSSVVESLSKLAMLLAAYPDSQLYMEGHADSYGDEEYNQHLSELRLDSVQSLFKHAGIDTERLHRRAYGERLHMENDDQHDHHAFDRRVTLNIRIVEATKYLSQH